MPRLRKKVAMDMTMFQGALEQTSQKGRDILKSLEDFKFTLEQTARLLNNNQQFSQGMIQKRKAVDEISNKLYQIVFDIENIDISEAFENQQQPVLQDMPTTINPGNPQNNQTPNPTQMPGQQPPQNAPGNAAPAAPGGGTPPPPSAGPGTKPPANGPAGDQENSDEEDKKPENDNSEADEE